MRIYFERWMVCTYCGRSERQTATTLPLDWIGYALAKRQKKWFTETHGNCESPVYYTSWRLGKIFKS